MSSLGDIGEFGLIHNLTLALSGNASLLCGPGDDCAVMQLGNTRLLLSCDAMVENIHFRRDWATPEAIGWKAAAAALSDIAAMGGTARCLLVTLGCPADTDAAYLEALYKGIQNLTEQYGVVVAGGDTVHTLDGILLDVTVVGEVETGIEPKYRSDAQPGDIVFVTGYPGASSLGMKALERGDKQAPGVLIEAHTHPTPRLIEGVWLARLSGVHAMIDISDGLVSDLGHIVERSGVGIAIEREKLPLSPEIQAYADEINVDFHEYALGGGEDYELALTVHCEEAQNLCERFTETFNLPLTAIGVVKSEGAGVWVDGKQSPVQGYNHFAE